MHSVPLTALFFSNLQSQALSCLRKKAFANETQKVDQHSSISARRRWKHCRPAPPPAVTARRVDGAVLAPHNKVVNVAQREGHGGDGHSFALLEHQLQTVLQEGWGVGGETESDSTSTQETPLPCRVAPNLRLRKHVQAPGAHLPVGGDADQVVGVLCSHHVHAVDGVLRAVKRGKGGQ